MRLDDAKAEVLKKVSQIVGTEISESHLTLQQKQALAHIADILRQLITIKHTVMIEETRRRRLIYRIFIALFGKRKDKLKEYLQQMNELQKLLDDKVVELAKSITEKKDSFSLF